MKRKSLSDQIREAVDSSGESRYRLCVDCKIHQAIMSRFMQGLGGLSMESLDRLAERLGWQLKYRRKVASTKTRTPGRPKEKGS